MHLLKSPSQILQFVFKTLYTSTLITGFFQKGTSHTHAGFTFTHNKVQKHIPPTFLKHQHATFLTSHTQTTKHPQLHLFRSRTIRTIYLMQSDLTDFKRGAEGQVLTPLEVQCQRSTCYNAGFSGFLTCYCSSCVFILVH